MSNALTSDDFINELIRATTAYEKTDVSKKKHTVEAMFQELPAVWPESIENADTALLVDVARVFSGFQLTPDGSFHIPESLSQAVQLLMSMADLNFTVRPNYLDVELRFRTHSCTYTMFIWRVFRDSFRIAITSEDHLIARTVRDMVDGVLSKTSNVVGLYPTTSWGATVFDRRTFAMDHADLYAGQALQNAYTAIEGIYFKNKNTSVFNTLVKARLRKNFGFRYIEDSVGGFETKIVTRVIDDLTSLTFIERTATTHDSAHESIRSVLIDRTHVDHRGAPREVVEVHTRLK